MFNGTFEHSIDDKNRMIIPRKLREAIDEQRDGQGFYITKGLDECLSIYTPAQWARVAEELRQKSLFASSKARHFHRIFHTSAERVLLDKQGRILIPDRLKNLAKLNKDVVILGVDDRIEVWNKDNFLHYQEEYFPEYESLAEDTF